jgi:hypothetical protein
MKTICFFASYFQTNDIPYYITVYLTELNKQFDEVVLLTSQKNITEKSIQFLKNENIKLQIEENEGFDFGLWYHAFLKYNVDLYDKIALVNDSCILFKSLDDFISWSNNNTADFQGMTKSNAISPHLQSYFILLNQNAIKNTKEYFNKHKLLKHISDVIITYEVGLSKFLLSKGLSMSPFVDNNSYNGEFSPYYYCVDYHLEKGIPLIKKKILFSSYRKEELFTLARMNFNINVDFYIRLIKKYNSNLLFTFENVLISENNTLTVFDRFKYNITRILINFYRKFKRDK